MRTIIMIMLAGTVAACSTLLQGQDETSPVTPEATTNPPRQTAAIQALERERQAAAEQRAQDAQRLREMDQMISRLAAMADSMRDAQTGLSQQLADLRTEVDGLAQLSGELDDVKDRLKRREASAARLDRDLKAVKSFVDKEQRERAAEDAAMDREAAELLEALGDEIQAFGVHLVTYRGQGEAAQGWRDFVRDHGDLLSDLEPRLEAYRLGELGTEFYRLIAGPFNDPDAASKLCQQLEGRSISCDVRAYRGSPLGS